MKMNIAVLGHTAQEVSYKWNRNPETFYTKNEDGETLLEVLADAFPEFSILFKGTGAYGLIQEFDVVRYAGPKSRPGRELSRAHMSISFYGPDGMPTKRPTVQFLV